LFIILSYCVRDPTAKKCARPSTSLLPPNYGTEMHKFRWNDTGNQQVPGELSADLSGPGSQVLRDAIVSPSPPFENLAK
jgi:hypothetical protein